MVQPGNSTKEPVAIIGMACVFPGAEDLVAFWRNIVSGYDAISEPTAEWDAARYLKHDRIKTALGGYLKELYRFDPLKFGIMPNSLDGGEPDHFMALKVSHEALVDSGYEDENYNHQNTGIILGHSTYLHRGQGSMIQHNIVLDQTIELLGAVVPEVSDSQLSEVKDILKKKLPQFNSDIASGLVPNVMTGRIANRLNFRGPNYLIDAACSSSLLAVGSAIDELRAGRSDLMLAGGVNASLPAEVSIIFTELGALSSRGRVRPFEAGSDGTLLGEGLGVVVLKRMSDAIRDGDKIYAIVHEVGQASDGHGSGLLAPSREGEYLAIRRAYDSANIDPATVGMVEAHGTGIPLGDKTEISALKDTFGPRCTEQGGVALGSVKSMISHCIPAAGIAGLIKSALALHHKILPPTLCDHVNPELEIDKTPLYVNVEAKTWINGLTTPRRTGNNSFGFGGINAHAIMEEAPPQAKSHDLISSWPAELCLFTENSKEALAGRLKEMIDFLQLDHGYSLLDIVASLFSNNAASTHRLSIVCRDIADLQKKLRQASKRLSESSKPHWSLRSGVFYSETASEGKLAYMFPGEGSQYINMLADLSQHFSELRTWLDAWSSLYEAKPGDAHTNIVYPNKSEMSDERIGELERRLHQMDIGSEAVFIASQALYSLLTFFGVAPDAMVGHSTGESSALAASGAMGEHTKSRVSEFIRQLNKVYKRIDNAGVIPTGALLAVGALSIEKVSEVLSNMPGRVVIAMDNCVNQIVLYGSEEDIAVTKSSLSGEGGICLLLPFDRGYHTSDFEPATQAFKKYYKEIELKAPKLSLYSCASVETFPDNNSDTIELASSQWSNPVRFRETIKKMHDDGIRTFVEVGPSANLTAFVNDILSGESYQAVACNVRSKCGVHQFLSLLGQLYVDGRSLSIGKLYENRRFCKITFDQPNKRGGREILMDNTMPVLHLNKAEKNKLWALVNGRRAGPAASTIPDSQSSTSESNVTASSTNINNNTAPSFNLNGYEKHAGMGGAIDLGDTVEAVGEAHFSLMQGFLDHQDRVLTEYMTLPEHAQNSKQVEAQEYPLISHVVERNESELVARCDLSVDNQNFLKNHILSGPVSARDASLLGLSCVPLTVSLEIMAEACCLLSNKSVVMAIENVIAQDWIALDFREVSLDVHVSLIDKSSSRYKASLSNNGTVAISAEFLFYSVPVCKPVKTLQNGKSFRLSDDELYNTGMFHGPIFQSIAGINEWNQDGIEARLANITSHGFMQAGNSASLVINPVLLDAVGQLAAYWIVEQVGTDFNCFPSTIDRIEFYSACPDEISGAKLRGSQHVVNSSRTDISATRDWSFECLDREGHPVFRIEGFRNVYFDVPNRFYEFRRNPGNGWLGGRCEFGLDNGVELWQLNFFDETFCAQSGAIFTRILAQAILNHDEKSEWYLLKGSFKKRLEWLFGRACIKEQVRYWVYKNVGELLYPTDIMVHHDEHGAPYVDGWWNGSLIKAPSVSLSHDRNVAVTALAPTDYAVGVDVEHIGRIQNPELLNSSQTKHEQELIRGLTGDALQEQLLRVWCSKEAAAKCTGLGFQGRPDAYSVSFTDEERTKANVDYQELSIPVLVQKLDTSVIALAVIEPQV